MRLCTSRLVPTLRADAAAPITDTVTALNAFAPRLLVGYASALRELAAEQAAGRLRIHPQAVMSASEVLTATTAWDLTAAWGHEPFDVYAATETAGIASPCQFHGRHLYEDLVICEVVDDTGAPVPEGTTGSRLLVTVLFSRTLPLIRYELSDRVALDTISCRAHDRSEPWRASRAAKRTSSCSPEPGGRCGSTPTSCTKPSTPCRSPAGRSSRNRRASYACW